MILETLGTPSKEKIDSIKDDYVSKKMKDACSKLEHFEKVPFEKILKGLDKEGKYIRRINIFEAYDLLDRMLELDY